MSAASSIFIGETDVLPPLVTRKELMDFCNRHRAASSEKITLESIKEWDYKGWITRHPAYNHPVRYIAASVRDFLDGKF